MARLVYQGRDIALEQDETILGRHRDCDIQLDDKAASRQHCKLLRRGERFELIDLGSANGTKLNGHTIDGPQLLNDGDLVAVGESRLKYLDPALAGGLGATLNMAPDAARRAPPSADTGSVETGRAVAALKQQPVSVKSFEPEDLVGLKVGGYRIQDIITTHSTGTIYTAKQLSLDRQVAVKVLSKACVRCRPGFDRDILDAARRAGRLQHEGIVQIHECGFDEGLLWYSMEYVEGDIVGRRLKQDGQLPLELVLLIADRVASALREAHAVGIPHCDIRPDNILISRAGTVKLVDFGVAPLLQEARQIIEKGSVRGNPLYIAPEYAADPLPHPLCDIYSLGCTLFHLITGRPPYTGHRSKDIVLAHQQQAIPSVAKLVDRLPTQLDDLLHGMLTKNPDWRFQSIDEWQATVKELRQALDQEPKPPARPGPTASGTPTSPTGSTPPRRRMASTAGIDSPRRRSGNWVGLVIFALVVVGAIVAFPYLKRVADRSSPFPQHPGTDPAVTRSDPLTDTGDQPPRLPPALPVPHSGQHGGSGPTTTRDPQVDPADPLRNRWQAVQQEVADLVAAERWSQAEFTLQRFEREARTAGATKVATVASSQLRQLQADAQVWYRNAVVDLPPTDRLNARLERLGELRGKVATGERPDLESRYRQTIDLLRRELAVIRRDIVSLIEQGELGQLVERADQRTGSLRGTAFVDLETQLMTQASEARHLPWQGDWPTTRQALGQATGEEALGAAAALMLMGDRQKATELLFRDQTLSGDLAQRRDALLATQAVILDFDSPSDLTHFTTHTGQPVSIDGALTADPGEPIRFDCTVPVGGDSWEASIDCLISADQGDGLASAQISIAQGDATPLTLQVEGRQLMLRCEQPGTPITQEAQREGDNLRLRLRAIDGRLQVIANDQTLLEGVEATLPPGSRLRFEFVGVAWQLDALQVIGGA